MRGRSGASPTNLLEPLPAAPVTGLEVPAIPALRTAIVEVIGTGANFKSGRFGTSGSTCATTFWVADMEGSCNGVQTRFPHNSSRTKSVGLLRGIDLLLPVNKHFPAKSLADLVVLVEQVAQGGR